MTEAFNEGAQPNEVQINFTPQPVLEPLHYDSLDLALEASMDGPNHGAGIKKGGLATFSVVPEGAPATPIQEQP